MRIDPGLREAPHSRAPWRGRVGEPISLRLVTSTAVRRLLAAAALVWLVGAATIVTAGPAAADTPEGWPEEEPIDKVQMLLVLGGIPLLVFLVVVALVYAPALARGESIAPGQQERDPEWIGGPRKTPDELAGPDTEGSKAGGASGTW
jgi:hypothetical protein